MVKPENVLHKSSHNLISLKTHSISIISKGFQLGSAFILFLLTSRWLEAEGRGEISLYIANQTILQLATEIIFGSGYIYLVHRFERGSIIFKGLIWSVACSLLLPIFFYFIGIQPFETMGWLTLSSFLFSIFTWITLDIRAQERIGLFNLLWIIYSALLLVYFIILFSLYSNVTTYFMSISGTLLSTILIGLFFVLRTKHPRISQPITWKSILHQGSNATWSNWINFFSTRSSYYIIIWFLHNESSVGLYGAAAIFSELIWIIPFALAIPLYPTISKEKNHDVILEHVNTSARLNAQLSLIIFILLCFTPESLLLWLIGESFVGIKSLLLLLLPGTYLLSQGKIYWNYFQGIGKFKTNTISAAYGLVFGVVISISLVPIIGIYGAAIGTCVSYSIYAFLLMYHYQKEDKQNWMVYFLPNYKKNKD